MIKMLPPLVEEICHQSEDSLPKCIWNVYEICYKIFVGDPVYKGNFFLAPNNFHRQTESQDEKTLNENMYWNLEVICWLVTWAAIPVSNLVKA